MRDIIRFFKKVFRLFLIKSSYPKTRRFDIESRNQCLSRANQQLKEGLEGF